MKKRILFLFLGLGMSVNAQIICMGVSPQSVVGSYDFRWADPENNWGTPDFNTPGLFFQDTLAMADDGTPGDHLIYGHPLSQQACSALDNGISDVTGKIAVIYRGDCEFGEKAKNAQDAGAIGVLVINHSDPLVEMDGGTVGPSVNIPVVLIGKDDGALVMSAMQNGPVEFFLGNKTGFFTNDVGARSDLKLLLLHLAP